MINNSNMANYADFTSGKTKVRVAQQPGGNSSLSLGWNTEPLYNPYVTRQTRIPNDKQDNYSNDVKPNNSWDNNRFKSRHDRDNIPVKPYAMHQYNNSNTHDMMAMNMNNPQTNFAQPVSEKISAKNMPIMAKVIQTPLEPSIGYNKRRENSEQPKSISSTPVYNSTNNNTNNQEFPPVSRHKDDAYRFGKQSNNDFFSPFKNNYNNMVRDFPVSQNEPSRQYTHPDYQQQQPRSHNEGQIFLHNNDGKTSVKVNNPPGGRTSIQLW